MLTLDPGREFHARVINHLERDLIGWLVTVDPDGTPQPSPVWFLWDGATILIYSQPDTGKLRNIARSPRASFHFDGDRMGGDIVVLSGTARVEPEQAPAAAVAAYATKYAEGMRRVGMTPEQFAAAYSVPVRITPDRLRGH